MGDHSIRGVVAAFWGLERLSLEQAEHRRAGRWQVL
jgi:hypothetical protein